MRILAVVGSTRRGNTYAMVEAAAHALTARDCDVELFHLRDLNLLMCNGCLSCDENGECNIDDDMKKILPDVLQADGFILGTPARWSLLSGELKVFIDRLNPLAAPQSLKGKKAIIFSVGQTEGEEAKSIQSAADSVKYFCENAGIEVIDIVTKGGCLNQDDLISNAPETLKTCKQSAAKLLNALTGE